MYSHTNTGQTKPKTINQKRSSQSALATASANVVNRIATYHRNGHGSGIVTSGYGESSIDPF